MSILKYYKSSFNYLFLYLSIHSFLHLFSYLFNFACCLYCALFICILHHLKFNYLTLYDFLLNFVSFLPVSVLYSCFYQISSCFCFYVLNSSFHPFPSHFYPFQFVYQWFLPLCQLLLQVSFRLPVVSNCFYLFHSLAFTGGVMVI